MNNKYIIEGGVDFFAELYKSLDTNDCEEKTEDDNNLCLITNQPLTDKFVTMLCGHKFNYIPLFYDIKNHKGIYNKMEATNSMLKKNEIRCPYCRKIQTELLPFHPELGVAKIAGVNSQEINKLASKNKCEYRILNSNFNPNEEESETNSKYILSCTCYNVFVSKISNFNLGYYNLDASNVLPIVNGLDNYYCDTHKKFVKKEHKTIKKEIIKKLILAEKQKAAQLKKLEKQKEKLEKQKEKQKEKLEKQKEKQKLKEKPIKPNTKININDDTDTIDLITDNVILGPTIIENKSGCVQILKSGPNKGNLCGCKIFLDNKCKRHSTNC